MIRTRTIALIAILLLGPTLLWGGERPSVELVIMATTDLHCKLLHSEGASGGLADAAERIAEITASADYSLLVDVGDAFEGGPVADYYALVAQEADHPMVEAMNRMQYAAMALGNHEFTYGLPFLRKISSRLSFPLLAANAEGPDAWWDTHTVLNVGPLTVLVIGTVTPWTALSEAGSLGEAVAFSDQVTCLKRLVPELRSRYHPDLTCVLAHTGAGDEAVIPEAEDQGLAIARSVRGIDVLFLGHSHRVFNERIGGVPVLQAGSRGSHIATLRVRVSLEPEGPRILSKEADVVAVTPSRSEPAYQALFERATAPVRDWLRQPVGSLARPASSSRAYVRQDGISRILLATMMRYSGADAALLGGITDGLSLPAGPVTRETLYSLQPYLNRIVTVKLSGEELAACLETAAATWAPYPFDGTYPPETAEGASRWSFLVAGGVEYALDYTQPPEERLVSLLKNDEHVDAKDTLLVAVTSYRKTGAGGYSILRSAPVVAESPLWLRTYLEDWFIEHPGYSSDEPAGWKSYPTYQGSWAQPVLDMFVRRFGTPNHVRLAWNAPPTPSGAAELAEEILEEACSPRIRNVLSADRPLTRGELLIPLVRDLSMVPQSAGAGTARFRDLIPGEGLSVWDSVVSGGLVAAMRGDSLKPTSPVTTAECAAFLLNRRFRHLTIVSTNDFHGHLEPNPRREQGGSAALGGFLHHERRYNPHGVVLLDAGDAMQGTPISNLFEGRSTIAIYNHLGYDALTVGNHEFDWGHAILRERIAQARFPFLGANVLAAGTNETVPWLKRAVTIERGGTRVGVIGVCTAATPRMSLAENMRGFAFQNVIEAFEASLPLVERGDPDLVILVGHLGLEEDNGDWAGEAAALGHAAADDVDIFFTGHNHQIYTTSVAGLPILQGGSYGVAVSVVRAWVDRLGRVEPWLKPSVERLGPSVWQDTATAEVVSTFSEELRPKTQVVITELAHPITTRSTRAGETPMGGLIAEAQRRMVGAHVALMNPGGVRRDLEAGSVTWEDLFQVQPFGNTLVKASLSGAELKRALEQGIYPSGSNIQVAGIEVWIDRSRSFGERVVRVQLENGETVKPDDVYTVVFNNFMGGGGDNYTVLRDAKDKVDTGIIDLDALIAYLQSFSRPASIPLEERMHLTGT